MAHQRWRDIRLLRSQRGISFSAFCYAVDWTCLDAAPRGKCVASLGAGDKVLDFITCSQAAMMAEPFVAKVILAVAR